MSSHQHPILERLKVLKAVADHTTNTDLGDELLSDEFLELVTANPKIGSGLQGGHDLGGIAADGFSGFMRKRLDG